MCRNIPQLRHPAGLERAWHLEIKPLAAAGLIQGAHRFRLTDKGRALGQELEPLVDALDLHEGLARAYLLARLGDPVAASECARRAGCVSETMSEPATRRREERLRFLRLVLRGPDRWEASYALAALSVFGKAVALPEVRRALAERPVSGLHHTALAALNLWEGADVTECLLANLIEVGRLSIGARFRHWLWPSKSDPLAGDQPRLGLIVGIVRRLLQILDPREFPPLARKAMVRALATNCRAVDHEAGLLLYLLDREGGRRRLIANLSSDIPHPRSGAACFLAMLGEEWCIDALLHASRGDRKQAVTRPLARSVSSMPGERGRPQTSGHAGTMATKKSKAAKSSSRDGRFAYGAWTKSCARIFVRICRTSTSKRSRTSVRC